MAGIYIHIPFCKQRCRYCGFFSSTNIYNKERYIKAVCHELEIRRNYTYNDKIDTIYIGGGTPSLLNEKDFNGIFSTIEKNFDVNQHAEITLEANPDDLSISYLTMLRSFSFNRISMGVQSFNDELLKKIGRRHDAQCAIKAVNNARDTGFDNISIDLIFALPDSTKESWEKDLKQAITLNPEHISAYNLTYEEGTALYHSLKNGEVVPLSEENNIEQFEMLIDTLNTAGYRHYEISNFAKPGHESKHNTGYWHDIPYIGCGAAAHSYDRDSRQWNIANIERYIKGIENDKLDCEIEQLNETERYNEAILTRLRTSDGLPLEWFKKNFKEKYRTYMQRAITDNITYGTLVKTGDNIKLTRKGIFISDAVIRDLIYIDD